MMEPTLQELQDAYNRTNLNRAGITFDKALACNLTKNCLVRLAFIKRKHSSEVLEAPPALEQIQPAAVQKQWWNKGQYE
jgi:hypothetical protein